MYPPEPAEVVFTHDRLSSPLRAAFIAFAVHVLTFVAGCGDDSDPVLFRVERPPAAAVAKPGGRPTPDVVSEPDTATSDTSSRNDVVSATDAPAVDVLAPDVAADVSTGTDTVNDAGPTPTVPVLTDLATRIALPWVPPDGRTSNYTAEFRVDPELTDEKRLSATIADDARLDVSALRALGGGRFAVDLVFRGAMALTRAEGRLQIRLDDSVTLGQATVFAMAGSASVLPTATWNDVTKNGQRYGRATTIRLGTAPFPHASGSWTDDSVHVFVPEGFTPRDTTDFVVHFHGHHATLAATLVDHRYREQLWASGANLVLVVPQGPVSAASGNFGKLMTEPGLGRLLDDVSAVLFRDRVSLSPHVGDLVLTEHSGGYIATAANLETTTSHGQVLGAHLFDGLYGRSADFEAFARAGGFLRSNHTSGGGTRNNNLSLLQVLGSLSVSTPNSLSLRDHRAVIWATTASHGDSTWWDQAFAESIRWAAQRSRRGPRVELRVVRVVANSLEVQWISPADDDLDTYVVETSTDGVVWTVAGEASPDATATTVPLGVNEVGRMVRVRSRLHDIAPSDTITTDAYWAGRNATTLVVDGFDRIIDGSFSALSHAASGRVGRAQGNVSTASNEAVVDGEVTLQDFDVVIWLLGDESTADRTFTPAEQARVNAYLAAGGRIIVSGSEVAWDLGARNQGPTFLAGLGATYLADNARASSAAGAGDLSTVGTVTFGGSGALYPEDFPDVVGAASGARIVLTYPDGRGAAAGIASKSVVVGFPLELVDGDDALRRVLTGLIGFVRP